jgi:hypothetical protein
MSGPLFNDLGVTDMSVKVYRGSQDLEVTSPVSTTILQPEVIAKGIQMNIVGGLPGKDGDAAADPGDFVPLINALLNQGI